MPVFGDVLTFQISPNGMYVVYLADQNTDGVNEIYSVYLGGGQPIRLNVALPSGRHVTGFQISPDSTRVIYRADQDIGGAYELYSVAIGGGSVVKLNKDLVGNRSVRFSFQVSPDSQWVVYWADQDTAGVNELYSVAIGGGSMVKLNPAPWGPAEMSVPFRSVRTAAGWFMRPTRTPLESMNYTVCPLGGERGQVEYAPGDRQKCQFLSDQFGQQPGGLRGRPGHRWSQ